MNRQKWLGEFNGWARCVKWVNIAAQSHKPFVMCAVNVLWAALPLSCFSGGAFSECVVNKLLLRKHLWHFDGAFHLGSVGSEGNSWLFILHLQYPLEPSAVIAAKAEHLATARPLVSIAKRTEKRAINPAAVAKLR